MEISRDQFKEAYGRVPETIRAYLASDELGDAAASIAQKLGFHVDASGILYDILTESLLGFVGPADFPAALTKRIGASPEQVTVMIREVNESIFIPLQARVREASERERDEAEQDRHLAEIDRLAPEEETVSVQPVAAPTPLPAPQDLVEPEPAPRVVPVNLPPTETLAQNPPAVPATSSPQPAPVQYVPYQQPAQVHAGAHPPGWHPAAALHIYLPVQPQQGYASTQVAPSYAAPSLAADTRDTQIQDSTPAQTLTAVSPTPGPNESYSRQDQAVPSVTVTVSHNHDPYRESV